MWNVLLNSVFFSRNGLPFSVFDLCHICLLSASWVLFLDIKLSIAFCEFILYLYIYNNFFQSQTWLCVITANTEISPNQKQHELYPVKFSSTGVLNLSNKDKANCFNWKISKKGCVETHKIDDSNLVLTGK